MRIRHTLFAAAFAAVSFAATPAVAGPPFICHAFELSGNPSLPWGNVAAAGWNNPDPTYDVSRLTADVTRLLTPAMPVSARMETLRRATIYASRDRAVATTLLKTLEAKAKASPGDANALFDAGFLTEAYGQASRVYEWDMLAGRAKEQWTFRKEPVGTGVTLIDAAVALNPPEAADMRRARSMLAMK
ncbi:MAG: hypothetical protein ABIT71_16690 [Vicinamibacteraceae bacterium]